MLVATGKSSVTYPVVVVEVCGIRCRALLDTGVGNSYASAALLGRIGKQPVRKEFCSCKQQTKKSKSRRGDWKSLGKFSPAHRDNKGERGVLLTLTNPWYKDILAKYDHLRGVEIDDVEFKRELPVHWNLRTSEYAKIKTETTPKMGKPGEPIAELTRLGWTLTSSGSETDLTKMFLTQTSRLDPDIQNWLRHPDLTQGIV